MATFRIALPGDYTPRFALRYMSRDPESETERGDGRSFVKALMVEGKPAVVQVEFVSGTAPHPRFAHLLPASGEKGTRDKVHRVPLAPRSGERVAEGRVRGEPDTLTALIRCEAPRAAVEPAVLRLLGLPFDPGPFEARHAKLVGPRRGMRVPQTATVFESIVWAVCGQQVNLAFAFKLRRVVIELAGKRVDGMRAHPDPAAVARLDYDDLTRRQFSRRKAEYLIDVARSGIDFEAMREQGVGSGEGGGPVPPVPAPSSTLRTPSSQLQPPDSLLTIRGFGVWSANYVMMRGCGFADCVPVGDSGLTSSLQEFYRLDARPDAEKTLALMKRFAPYRSLATFHFWMRKSDAGF